MFMFETGNLPACRLQTEAVILAHTLTRDHFMHNCRQVKIKFISKLFIVFLFTQHVFWVSFI